MEDSNGQASALKRLRELFRAIPESGPRLALLEGPSGVGKDRLVEKFTAGLGTEVHLGQVDCAALADPFGGLVGGAVDALRALGSAPASLADLRCRAECHTYWFQHRGPVGATHPGGHQHARSFVRAVREVFVQLATVRPTVLTFRRLDLADDDTLGLIAQLLRLEAVQAGALPKLFIVATGRDESPSPHFSGVRTHPRSVRIPIAALDEAGLREVLSSKETLAQVLRSTGGLPAAVDRLLSSRVQSVDEHFGSAFDALNETEKAELLLVTAAAPRGLSPGDLADLAQQFCSAAALPQPTNADSDSARAPQMRSTGLVRMEAGLLHLTEDDTAGRVLDRFDPERLLEGHRQLAAFFFERGELRAALRHASAGKDVLVLKELLPAALDYFVATHAYQVGARLVGKARQALEGAGEVVARPVLEGLMTLHLGAGDFRSAGSLAVELWTAHPADTELARSCVSALVLAGRGPDALAKLERLCTRVTESKVSDELGVLRLELLYQEGKLSGFADATDRLLPAKHLSAESRLSLLQMRAKLSLAQSRLDEALRRYTDYEREALNNGDGRHHALAVLGRAVALLSSGAAAEAEEELLRSAELAERCRARDVSALVWHNLGASAHLRHEYRLARERYERALSLLQLVENRSSMLRCAYNLGELYETLGALDRARSLQQFGTQAAGGTASPRAQADGFLLRGRIALAESELGKDSLGEARTAFETAESILSGLDPLRATAATIGLVRVALRVDDLERAAERLAEVPGELPPVRAADARLARAELAARLGDGRAEFLVAVEAARHAGGGSPLIEALVGSAEAHNLAGDAKIARSALREALALDGRLAEQVPADLTTLWDDRTLRRRLLAVDVVGSRRRPSDVPPRSLDAAAFGIVGTSGPIQLLRQRIDRVGPSDCNVLIHGESGTGKELVANALHQRSSRRSGPMVCVNCAAIVDSLLLSELFGHERGAFTGAHAQKRGCFEIADGGTLFLDEIGDVSPGVQAALLRVIQEMSFQRVGGQETIRVDVRIIVATNRDLLAMNATGAFREDLYYRCSEVAIETPALRDRTSDIVLLAEHFLTQIAIERGTAKKRLSPDARTSLTNYPWPGNVRQLENCLRAATLFADEAEIQVSDLELGGQAALLAMKAGAGENGASAAKKAFDRIAGGELTLRDLKKELERKCIQLALGQSDGNISRAAALLGMKRPRLSQLVKEYGLRQGEERVDSQ